MSKIHPVENKCEGVAGNGSYRRPDPCPTKLTVWKRSSMSFQGTDGFTVFDEHGRLVFRMDNYSRKGCRSAGGGLVLMDGAGNGLMSLRPQILSMQCQWNAYRGEDECKEGQNFKLFSMRRASSFLHRRKEEAEVFVEGSRIPAFTVEGSFGSRNCTIRRCGRQELVAKITRKRASPTVLLGTDVFNLVVQDSCDSDLVMAFVVIMDRICSKSFAPALCS
ncbi:protein LURP-one-related 5-like [Rhodamnia argentea]|uniref:Protein LURP-one-related 5-like n=1 Tax=Rhodamnia argentea TaxID=178133 RepID=A0A8B8QCQ0_9MYRT|nr:protein LURP-one-related 5-like [Rhodamnia argentea]